MDVVHRGSIGQLQDRIIGEVALLHRALVERNRLTNRRGQAHDRPALNLRRRPIGIDDAACVDNGRYLEHLGAAVFLDRRFDNVRDDRLEAFDNRDTTRNSFRRWRAQPLRFATSSSTLR